jgi:hypothetical protein
MTIEATLSSIAESLARIATSLERAPATVAQLPVLPELPAPTKAKAPKVEAPVEVIAPTPVAEMPAVPFPEAVPECPITDAASLRQYVVSAFTSLGERGGAIQGIITSLGCTGLNDITPDHYRALFAAIEKLKAA